MEDKKDYSKTLLTSDNFEKAINDYDNAHENDDVSWDEYRKGEINNI